MLLLRRSLALCFFLVVFLVLCQSSSFAQSAPTAVQPTQPEQPQAPMPAVSALADPAKYVAQQFGPSFKVNPKFPPMFGDLDGDGNEDVVLFANSATPLLGQEQFEFKVEDPYDAYFGSGDPAITSEFNLHMDGSSDIVIVLGWRLPPQPVRKSNKAKRVSKFVLINTPFRSCSMTSFRLKKKDIQAIETVDRTNLHSIVFWDGKRWRWNAQGIGEEGPFQADQK